MNLINEKIKHKASYSEAANRGRYKVSAGML